LPLIIPRFALCQRSGASNGERARQRTKKKTRRSEILFKQVADENWVSFTKALRKLKNRDRIYWSETGGCGAGPLFNAQLGSGMPNNLNDRARNVGKTIHHYNDPKL